MRFDDQVVRLCGAIVAVVSCAGRKLSISAPPHPRVVVGYGISVDGVIFALSLCDGSFFGVIGAALRPSKPGR